MNLYERTDVASEIIKTGNLLVYYMRNSFKDKTILKIKENDCTGCGACFNICPLNAISMEPNKEGFTFPRIDVHKCIQCSKCISVCQVVKTPALAQKQDCYALALSDAQLRKKSSSGGAFSLLASYVLERDGVVCGAVYSDDYSTVYHAWAKNKADLGGMRGSKYVQSDTLKTYSEAKEYLESGKYVLYTGTPCQIHGLLCFLGKQYDTLITTDIVCHGVPSPEIFRKYQYELAEGRKIERLDFRDKDKWGWGTATSLFFTDGTVYYGDCYKDSYWRAFLGGLSTRKSCGHCRFANIHRVGDFTIGDFWGVAELSESCDDKMGTSLLIVNSGKGKRLFTEMKTELLFCKYFSTDTLLQLAKRRNGQLIGPKRPHEMREVFFEKIAEGQPFFAAFESVTKQYDVGYIGWWDSKNYGSALTSYAMNRTLKHLGKSVIMLEHPSLMPGERIERSYGIQFARKYYTCSKITEKKDFNRFNNTCRCFLVGSDQLWNWWNIKQRNPEFFFLDFAWRDKKKIAYATSFGMDHTAFPDDMRIKIGYFLSRFDHISTREKSGVRICREVFGVDADHVLDPVFLCPTEDYLDVINSSGLKMDEPYLFSYILDPTQDKLELVKSVAERKGLPYKIAIDGLGKEEYIFSVLKNDSNIMNALRIEDWLNLLYHSSYVVTDSFHGLCFSTIFGKQVIAYVNAHRGEERFTSIMDLFGIRERLVYSAQEATERNLINQDIDYISVNKIMDENRRLSMAWLKNALDSPKKEMSVKELNRWKVREHDKMLYGMLGTEDNLEGFSTLSKKLTDMEMRLRVLEAASDPLPRKFARRINVLKRDIAKGHQLIREHGLKECLVYVRETGLGASLRRLRNEQR